MSENKESGVFQNGNNHSIEQLKGVITDLEICLRLVEDLATKVTYERLLSEAKKKLSEVQNGD